MAPSRQARKENITRIRRQQIIGAALAVFAEKGFAMATTAEIARVAGVAEGTIYNYFKNKRALFIAVINDFIINVPLADLIDKLPEGDIGATFKQIIQNRLDLFNNETVLRLPSLMGEIQRDPELKALWRDQFLQPFLSSLEAGYREMSVSGKIRRIEPAVAVRAVGGMIIGFMLLLIMEGRSSPLTRLPRKKVAEEMVEFALHGLIAEKGAEKK